MKPKQKNLQKASPAGPAQPTPAVGSDNYRTVLGVCALLLGAVWLVFGQTLGHGFVNYDDDRYVYGNSQVMPGLSLKGIEWAFTHSLMANWHPLTVISHMLDCQLYGLHAGGHHLTSVLLHAAAAICLFLVLREMTGTLWRSAFVAAVFAIHPLRVESVAWVAERKDVLSGLFFMLTLGAYVRYVRKPASAGRYLTVVLLFDLGLMCKPMLVTTPFVLLLLDYWPLNRWGTPAGRYSNLRRLIVEKIPLIVLSIAACLVTLLVQHQDTGISLFERISNALVSYVAYGRQMFYPAGLAVMYPYPNDGWPAGKIILSLLLLAAVSAGAFCWRRKRPYFLMGWLWYLGMLVPVIGLLLQVGAQSRADRYTYLPQIGLYILLTWTVAELTASWRSRRWMLGGGAAVILTALIICARHQTAYWRDSKSLWEHTLACTSGNSLACNNLAWLLATLAPAQGGDPARAVALAQRACELTGHDDANSLDTLAVAYAANGRFNDAIATTQTAITLARSGGQAELLQKMEARLELYRAGRAYHPPPT